MDVTSDPEQSADPVTPPPAPGSAGRVVVALLTDGEPVRLCQRLAASLEDTPWSLEHAFVAAEQVYPVAQTAVGSAARIVECVLVRSDGGAAHAHDLPAHLERLNVVDVRPAPQVAPSGS